MMRTVMSAQRPHRARVYVPATALVAALAWAAPPSAAQGPLDLFGAHSGATRRPAVANQAWVSLSAYLLTQFDGRFEDPSMPAPGNPPFIRHDDLQASVGYNYVSLGLNHVITRNLENWIPKVMPRNTALTGALSVHFGVTDVGWVLGPGQDELHDFRAVTRNFHSNVADGFGLAGLDAELLIWPESKWVALGGHVSRGTFHQETAAKLVLIDRNGNTKTQVTFTVGDVAPKGPLPVKAALDDGYVSLLAGIEYTDRYGASVAYSSGIFPDEREFLLSLFVGVQAGSRTWIRLEFVNDLLGGKDRGFTGGGRVGLARTF